MLPNAPCFTALSIFWCIFSSSFPIQSSKFFLFFIVAEYLGEKLADFFGITSPKYQYVIDEYYRMKREVYFVLLMHTLKLV